MDANQKVLVDALNELQKKELIREGKESVEEHDPSDVSLKRQNMLMAWVERNQFWLLFVLFIIAVQGGKIGDWILQFFGQG